MNKLLSILLAGLLSCSGLTAFARSTVENVEVKKAINAVRIYQVYNPSERLSDSNNDSNLSILFARGNKMPQYLIMSGEPFEQEVGCLSGRFLVNLKSRLAFVNGQLYGDSLLVYTHADREERMNIRRVSKNGEGEYHPALFSFRLVDDREDGCFLIESWAESLGSTKGEWVKIADGTPVAVNTTLKEAKAGKADIFNLDKTETKLRAARDTDQETVADQVSVTAGYGALTIKGAEGEKITVRNSAGQIMGNEIARSTIFTMSAPAGIALVSIGHHPVIKTLVK